MGNIIGIGQMDKDQHILSLTRALKERDAKIHFLLQSLRKKDEQIQYLLEALKEKDIQIQFLLKENEELRTIISKQAERITNLEKQIGLNSGNSSKPPSSDGLKKPPRITSLREKGQHKSGGQKGHEGHTLRQVENPDHVVDHKAKKCPHCDISLENVDVKSITHRQVFDIPSPKIEVTEHRIENKICPNCHKVIRAECLEEVNAPTQYGQTVKSYAVYLQQQQLIPENRLKELFLDLFHLPITTATIVNFSRELNIQLINFNRTLLEAVKQTPVKHLDETGFRIAGKTQWLHVASTDKRTYYHVNPKRSILLKGLKGTVVHDHWMRELQEHKKEVCYEIN